MHVEKNILIYLDLHSKTFFRSKELYLNVESLKVFLCPKERSSFKCRKDKLCGDLIYDSCEVVHFLINIHFSEIVKPILIS